MARTWTILAMGALAICAGVVIVRALPTAANHHPAETRADLVVAPEELKLGTVWEDEAYIRELSIQNHETVPVEIEKFSSTCNCLSIEPKSLTIPPGETRIVRLTIDLVTKPPPDGKVSVRLTPVLKEGSLDGKRFGPEWMIAGQARQAIKVDRSFDLGRHSELAQPLRPWTIPVEPLVPLEKLSAQSGVSGITAAIHPPDGESSNYRLTLAATGELPISVLEGTVTIAPVRQGGEKLPARRIYIRGKIISDLSCDPPTVQVGLRKLGETFGEEVALRSLTRRYLGMVQSAAEGEGLTVESIGENRFRIHQTVNRTGSQTNQVRFSATITGRKLIVSVPVEYTGLGPD